MSIYFQKKSQILKKLRKNPLESLELLSLLESCLKKRRGFVFKIPRPGTRVIMLLSGGLDTAITAEILLKEYKLKIIPVFFDITRDNRKDLLLAAKKVVDYFGKKYPKKVEPIVTLTSTFPPHELVKYIFENCWRVLDKKTGKFQGLPFELDTLAYGIITLIQNNIRYNNIRNIYFGIHVGDTLVHQHHTLTAFRSLMFHICSTLGDFTYQITSIPIEKDLGLYLTKPDLISFGVIQKFPFEITRTCRAQTKYPCGRCTLCAARKYEFEKAGVSDNIIYEDMRTDLIGRFKKRSHRLAKFLIGF